MQWKQFQIILNLVFVLVSLILAGVSVINGDVLGFANFAVFITIGLVLLSAQLDERRVCDRTPTTVKSLAILAVLLAIATAFFVMFPPNVDATVDNAAERAKNILNYMKILYR
jgi:cytochrome bd-type quinol oxidase subunit 2